MIRLNILLYGFIVFGGIAHAGYSLLNEKNMPNGTYFSNGVFLMSDGSITPINTRMQLKNNSIYDFVRVGAWHHDFFRTVESRTLGNFKLKTVSANPAQAVPAPPYSDEDIIFNMAYNNAQGVPLTLYAIPQDKKILCFYVKELNKVRCLSQKRYNDIQR